MTKASKKVGLFGLSLGALGVVYGDIGTSPLYAVNEILLHADGNRSTEFVLGAISTVFWALTIIVSLKYVILVLRADNDGEGGVFSLFAQLQKYKKPVIGFLTSFSLSSWASIRRWFDNSCYKRAFSSRRTKGCSARS